MDKEQQATLEAVKQYKQTHYIGSKAALHLVREHKESIDLELRLKAEIEKQGISPAYGPSYIELEEAQDGIQKISNDISASIEREYKEWKGIFMSAEMLKEEYKTIREPAKKLFIESFALNRAKMAELDKESAKNEGLIITLGDLVSFALYGAKMAELESPKNKGFIIALGNYKKHTRAGYNTFAQENEFPADLIEKAFAGAREKVSRDAGRFLQGFYAGELESERLQFVGMEGAKHSEVLYDRLEREQILHRDEMQKLYLSRHIAESNIRDYEEFKRDIQLSVEISPIDSEREKDIKKYLRLIVNRHKQWIKNLLS